MRRRLSNRTRSAWAAVGLGLALTLGVGLAGGTARAQDPPRPTPADPADAPLELPPTPADRKPAPKTKPKVKSAPKPKAADASGPPAQVPPDFFTTKGAPDLGPPSVPPAPVDPAVAPAGAKGDDLPGPAEGLPTPAALPPPSDLAEPPRDPAVEPAQAPTPMPAAQGKPPAPPANAGAGPGEGPAAADDSTSLVLPPERLPLGRQTLGLTVDVVSPQYLNLNQSYALKIVVKNEGKTDAQGVVVRDELPETLSYVSSQPEATRIDPTLCSWKLGNVPAGSERVITLTVKPTKVGPFDHAATVSMVAGARSRTVVREPKLKVELTSNTSKVVRDQPVEFRIAITNTGDGPARNVVIQAKLSPGLKYDSGEPNADNVFEQEPIDLIKPGERLELTPLVVDAVLGGDQSCSVFARSADVDPGHPDGKASQSVTVVEPKLKMTLTGPESRYTDTLAHYEVKLENPGTSPSKNVRLAVTVPVSGKLQAPLAAGARFDPKTRQLTWSTSQIEPGASAVVAFDVRTGGIGLYQVAAQAKFGDGRTPPEKGTVSTSVEGLADVKCSVEEKLRVVDVNDQTIYTIKVVNSGTKEATNILISADLSKNIEALQTKGTDRSGAYEPTINQFKFPVIPRLGPGKSMELAIWVKALNPGLATCTVRVLHDGLSQDEGLVDFAAFKVTNPTTRR